MGQNKPCVYLGKENIGRAMGSVKPCVLGVFEE